LKGRLVILTDLNTRNHKDMENFNFGVAENDDDYTYPVY